MSKKEAADGFIIIFILAIGGILVAVDPGVEAWELDMYAHGVHVWHTIYEFDTKKQAIEAERIVDEELGGCAGLLDPKGPLWDRRWPVELLSPYYWDKPENWFRWNETTGKEIIHKVATKEDTQ